MIGSTLDRLIGVFAPTWGAKRIAARATMAQIESLSGTGLGGYDAGKLNRLNKGRTGSRIKENAVPLQEVQRLRWQAWQLWRNNPYARKAVRSLTSKVIGKGMTPASLAKNADGTPFTKFRDRAHQLWNAVQTNFDFRGVPGQGGTDTVGLDRIALRAVILGGDCLWQMPPIDEKEQTRRGLPLPITFQLIDGDRLAAENTIFQADAALPKQHQIYRGIELDETGRRAAYWLYDYPLGAVAPLPSHTKRIEAKNIGHLFVEEDIDQLRGVSWFASTVLQLRDVGDLVFNELTAEAMAACVVFGFNRPTGARQLGLNPNDGQPLVDDDGNKVTYFQPGQVVDLGRDGKLQAFTNQRNAQGVESFAQFMLRGVADSIAGTKASTITGDYRGSSYSSERSADNDVWPELEEVQGWFALNFKQPQWEKLLDVAVALGWFEGIIRADEYLIRRAELVAAHWQGPVARSINPVDDANSAGLRMKFAISSPQVECAAVGKDWRAILRDHAEFRAEAKSQGLPDIWVENVLSVPGSAQAAEVNNGGGAGGTEDDPPDDPPENESDKQPVGSAKTDPIDDDDEEDDDEL